MTPLDTENKVSYHAVLLDAVKHRLHVSLGDDSQYNQSGLVRAQSGEEGPRGRGSLHENPVCLASKLHKTCLIDSAHPILFTFFQQGTQLLQRSTATHKRLNAGLSRHLNLGSTKTLALPRPAHLILTACKSNTHSDRFYSRSGLKEASQQLYPGSTSLAR